jgi:dTDP-4-amino-4,6-dideoxygalactose transaminase
MIKLIKPYISYDDVEKDFRKIFESGVFTRGEYVQKFSDSIQNYVHSKYCILTSSATTALTSSLKILGIKHGDEVLCSDFSFPATANTIEDIGAIPIFVDVNLDTFNMNIDDLESKITSKSKAVIFVDALGNPSGVHKIKDLCKSKNIPLIQDSACAIGSSENGMKVGTISDLTCFSFHPRKLITTGEGGAITTNNEEYFETLKVKLLHGAIFNNDSMDFINFGYNYRLPDLQCSMGIIQIFKLDKIVKERNEIRNLYIQKLEPLGFEVQKISKNVIHNVQSLVFKMPIGKPRIKLTAFLKDNGIESTLGTYSMSSTSYYSKKYNNIQKNSSELQATTITLPCYEGVDVEFVSGMIKNWINNA